MRYGSVCSGIEAATVAWRPLGWEAAWFSEIEKFPCAVLKHHYPSVSNLGDMTKITEDDLGRHASIDLLVGGTPCQAFSVAGLRGGLDDPRGNLALRFVQLAKATHARWVVWENVPGVLSSWTDRETFTPSEESCQAIREAGLDPGDFEEVDQTADFDCILAALSKLGYGLAYRVLDAENWGVPQRRRRVFVVGYLGDWRRAVAVLFERGSLSGNSATCREAKSDVTGTLDAGFGHRWQPNHLIPIDMRQASRGGTMTNNRKPGSSGGAPGTGIGKEGDPSPTLSVSHPPAVAYRTTGNDGVYETGDRTGALNCGTDPNQHVLRTDMSVRRLTPRECERLQGFPDGYTNIPYGRPKYPDQICPDGPRYKAIGNSMAVPVVRWIGERIAAM